MCKFNISKSPEAINSYIGIAALVALAGLPKLIAYKIIDAGIRKADKANILSRMSITMSSTIFYCFSGDYRKCRIHDQNTFNEAIRKGELDNAVTYTIFLSYAQCEIGAFDDVYSNIETIREISDRYDYRLAKMGLHILQAYLSVQRAQLSDAIRWSNIGMSIFKNDFMVPLTFLSLMTEAHLLSGDLEKAGVSLIHSDAIFYEQKIYAPFAISCYLVTRLMFDVEMLEHALSKDDPIAAERFKKAARERGKTAIKKMKRVALRRTKTFRLMGKYYWLIGKQRKALKWWAKAIQKGEALGARPDLSRTYFEVGKRLLEDGSRYKQLNGITAQEYLEKARGLFEEMDLQRDLKELERVVSAN